MTERRRLRIVHLVSSRRHAGVENYVARVAKLLALRGHEISVISKLPCAEFVPNGVKSFDVTGWKEASRVARRLGHVDIFHSHTTEADTAAALAARGRRTPIVSTRHFASRRWSPEDGQGTALLRLASRRPSRRSYALRRRFESWVDRQIEVNIAVSNFVASRMGRCEAVVLTGIATNSDIEPIEDRPLRALLLQRLESHKATDVAIAAWGRSSAAQRGWHLDIYGEGRERAGLASLIEELGLGTSVHLMGRSSDPNSLLRSASLLLAPALDDPFPLTVLEAMSYGVPVIASASGGHMESIGRVAGARLFPPGEVSALATLTEQMTNDVSERRRLSLEELEVQRSVFSQEAMCDRLEDIYFSLIESAS